MTANKIYIFCFGVVALLVSLFLALPTIASSGYAKAKIEAYANKKINGSISFENLDFSFWSHQVIEGIKVKDASGNQIASIPLLSIETSFPEMLFKGIFDSPLQFSDASLVLQEYPDGTSNLSQILNLNNNLTENNKVKSFFEPISLQNVKGNLDLSSSDPLQIRLKGLTIHGEKKGSFNLDITLKGIDSKNIAELETHPELLFDDSTSFNIDLDATNFPVALLDSLLSMQTSKYKPNLLVSTFGDTLNIKLNKTKNEGKSLALELNATAPNLKAHFVGELTEDKIYTTAPSTLTFSLTQELVDYFSPINFGYELKNPANLTIALREFGLPFNLKEQQYNLLSAMFKGRIDLSEAHLVNNAASDIALKKFSAFIDTEANSEDLNLRIDGDASQNNLPIKIALETVLHKSLNFRKHKFPPLKIDLKHIPVAAIDQLIGTGQSLSKIIGTYADLKIEALVHKNHLDLQLQFDSEKLAIPSMKLKIDEDLTMVETPTIKYTLDESTAKKILPENAYLSFKKDEPLSLNFQVNPIRNIYEIDDFLAQTFSGIVKIHHIALNAKESHETIFLQEIVIPWELNLKNHELDISFSGNTKHSHKPTKNDFTGIAYLKKEEETLLFEVQYNQTNEGREPAEVIFKGNIDQLLTKDGALNIHGLGLNLDASIANLPTPLFCKAACLEQNVHKKIEVLFGDFLNANVRLRLNALNGLVHSDVKGQEGSFSLDATLKDGNLFLNQPFQAKFTATERLGKSILHDIFPILSGVVSSDQPILIAIANEGFIFPLKDFDLSKIEIPQAILSLGHVKFDKSGELATVLELLTPADTDLISVWFTPLYFNMSEGILKLERVDLLISNKFPIASWGKIDFIKDKVKMMIGMSGYALTHAFKIKGLENDYMMQIPFTGTTKSATIDKVNATTKIGALIAQGQGGPKGLVLGTVLSLAGGALTEEKPPKSTTIPLPWAEELKSTSEKSEIATEQPKEKVKKKSSKLKIDKMLEHQVQDIFNGLLN